MLTKEVIIQGSSELDSKFSAMLIQKASRFKSSIWIEKEERKANAKSLLGVLSLRIEEGSKIRILAEGEDEEVAVKELNDYLSAQTINK
mgnify:CR=1 FL=1